MMRISKRTSKIIIALIVIAVIIGFFIYLPVTPCLYGWNGLGGGTTCVAAAGYICSLRSYNLTTGRLLLALGEAASITPYTSTAFNYRNVTFKYVQVNQTLQNTTTNTVYLPIMMYMEPYNVTFSTPPVPQGTGQWLNPQQCPKIGGAIWFKYDSTNFTKFAIFGLGGGYRTSLLGYLLLHL